MNKAYYETLFKRKSFHTFRNIGNDLISEKEIEDIKKAYESFDVLYPEIKTKIRIVPSDEINFKEGAQYCILIYSEEKDNYLLNAGYIGEQLDLYLTNNNIASLWYGMGKTDEKQYEGLSYVIMIAIKKVNDHNLYRKDFSETRRKELKEIWEGDDLGIGDIVRFAPSAVNSQPWYVVNENNILSVYHYSKPSIKNVINAVLASHYNCLDMGIFLCFMEICLQHKEIKYERELFIDQKINNKNNIVAKYKLIR